MEKKEATKGKYDKKENKGKRIEIRKKKKKDDE